MSEETKDLFALWDLQDKYRTEEYDNKRKSREQIQLFKRSILVQSDDPKLTMAPMFRAKIKEIKEDLCEKEKYVSGVCKQLAFASSDQVWFYEMRVRRAKDEVVEERKQLKKFTFYLDICKGKANLATIDIVEIKKVPISEFMSGPPKNRSPGRWMYKCPVHEDDSPSFVWYIEQNKYHCFGCQANGDVIDLFQRLNACDFKTAINELIKY